MELCSGISAYYSGRFFYFQKMVIDLCKSVKFRADFYVPVTGL